MLTVLLDRVFKYTLLNLWIPRLLCLNEANTIIVCIVYILDYDMVLLMTNDTLFEI
jgi:hypothetical protein